VDRNGFESRRRDWRRDGVDEFASRRISVTESHSLRHVPRLDFVETWYMATPAFYYAYVLLSEKDHKFYIGSTSDLKKRIEKHRNGLVNATRNRLPVVLIFYEAYLNKYDAIRREDYFKTTKGKRTLRNILKEYLS